MTSAALSDNIRTSTPTIQYIAEIGINNEYNIDESFPPSHRSFPLFSSSYLYSLLPSLLPIFIPSSPIFFLSLLSPLLSSILLSSILPSSLLFSSPLFSSPLLSALHYFSSSSYFLIFSSHFSFLSFIIYSSYLFFLSFLICPFYFFPVLTNVVYAFIKNHR